jgi:hypothetical protein
LRLQEEKGGECYESISTLKTRLQEVMFFWFGIFDETPCEPLHAVVGLLQGPRGEVDPT